LKIISLGFLARKKDELATKPSPLSAPMAADRSRPAHTEADQRIIDNLAVIGAYPDSPSALHDYARLHHAAPDRELYVAHTDRAELDITERRWLGIRRSA
jgi:hypothetical protein